MLRGLRRDVHGLDVLVSSSGGTYGHEELAVADGVSAADTACGAAFVSVCIGQPGYMYMTLVNAVDLAVVVFIAAAVAFVVILSQIHRVNKAYWWRATHVLAMRRFSEVMLW